MKITIASGPVIIERGCVLLDKHGKDKFWKFPGGRMKKGETTEQACKKRVKEELGINVQMLKPIKPMVIWRKAYTRICMDSYKEIAKRCWTKHKTSSERTGKTLIGFPNPVWIVCFAKILYK